MTSPDSKSSPTPTTNGPVLAAGQKLAGCYLLQKQVETGAAGSVWLAHDEVLGRDISLHFLPSQVRNDERALEEIRKEVKKNRQLIHPNILRVHDLIEEPEFIAVSMDSISGQSLASLLKQSGSVEPGAIQPWINSLCQTLEEAHKVNFVHRDLAPANIFVGGDGKVVLANFGISRCVQDALGRVSRGSNPRLSYLSPQLADGQTPVRTDDVYSLGMLLFELLTGELPFNGGDVLSQIKRVAAPRVSARLAAGRRNVDLPGSWDETIAAALRKDATQRPATALEIAAKLEKVAVKATTPAESAPAAAKKTEAPAKAAPAGDKPAAAKAAEPAKSEPQTPAESKPAAAVASSTAAPSEPPPRKAVEILRERAAELARTKSAGSTPVPTASGENSPPPTVRTDSKVQASPAKKDATTELAPSLQAQRSRGPALALAAGIAIAAIAGVGYYLQDSSDSKSVSSEDVDIATTEEAYASEIRSVTHKTTLPAAPAAGPSSAPSVRTGPEVQVQSKAETSRPPVVAARPPVASATPPPARPVLAPDPVAKPDAAPVVARVEARIPEAPAVAAIAAAPIDENPEPTLLAANQPAARKSESSSKPAASSKAAPASETPVSASPEVVAEKQAALEKLKQALQASEQAQEGLLKQQQQIESATTELQKLLDQKSKDLAPLRKSAEDLQKTRKQREEAQKAAELEAQKAQQLAAEKTRLAEEARKALADLDAQNQEKMTAQQKADAEIAALRATLTEKQQAATTASKAVNDAKLTRAQQQAAVEQAEREVEQTKMQVAKAMAAETARKAREEAEKLVAEKAKERQRIEGEIAAMKKMFEEKMKVLEDAQKAISDAEAKTKDTEAMQKKAEEEALKLLSKPAPATGTKPPSPGKDSASVAAPSASAPAAADNSAAQAPVATLAMKTEPVKSLTPPADSAAGKTPAPAGALPENSLGMKFVPVGDVHFAIWQTRVKDFEVFAKAVDLRSNAWKGPGFKQEPTHPVVNVTWHEAVAFCKWLTDKERKDGALPANQLYRLPTDLEWSNAVGLAEETGRNPEARDMGIPDVYPWGTQWPPPASAGNYTGEETGSDVAIKGYDDGFAWTSPVGSFPPNKFGLYDMGGNVWQWVMDAWNGESKHKVLRGASWYNGALKLSLLSSCRVHAAPDSSTDNYGFRIVRASDGGKSSR